MKYFRCTNKKDPEEIFYTYSSSDATTVEDVSRILVLEDYQIEECSQEEFERETAEEDPQAEEDPKAEALRLLDEIRSIVCGYADGASCSSPPSHEDLEELEAKLSELNRKVEAI